MILSVWMITANVSEKNVTSRQKIPQVNLLGYMSILKLSKQSKTPKDN